MTSPAPVVPMTEQPFSEAELKRYREGLAAGLYGKGFIFKDFTRLTDAIASRDAELAKLRGREVSGEVREGLKHLVSHMFFSPGHVPSNSFPEALTDAILAHLTSIGWGMPDREHIIEVLMLCDGPAVMQPSVNGYEERLARWEKSRREMAEKRADALLRAMAGRG